MSKLLLHGSSGNAILDFTSKEFDRVFAKPDPEFVEVYTEQVQGYLFCEVIKRGEILGPYSTAREMLAALDAEARTLVERPDAMVLQFIGTKEYEDLNGGYTFAELASEQLEGMSDA